MNKLKICKNGKPYGYSGHYNEPEYIEKQRKSHLGEKNGMWKGGISLLPNSISHKKNNKRETILKNCYKCHSDFLTNKNNRKFCSRRCFGLYNSGDNNPAKRPEVRLKLRQKIFTDEQKLKISLSKMGDKNPMKNPITALKHAISKTGIPNPKVKEYWRINKEKQILAMVKGLNKSPTLPEKKLLDIINELNLPYKYVGDWKFIIGGRNPDFINVNGQKKLIEVFGTYWHTKRTKGFGDTEAGKKEHYKKYGFDCLVIWDNELENKDLVIEKIKNFDGGERK